jgi:hypothetical protein
MMKKEILLTYFLILFPNVVLGFLDACLGSFLENEYEISETMIGFSFFLGSLTYIFLCPLIAWIAKKSKANKTLLFFGTLISGGALLLMGPSMGIPKNVIYPYAS